MRFLLSILIFCTSGCALDSTVIKWHDGKVIRISGNSKSLVKIKLDNGEVEVDSRKPSTLKDLMLWMMMKTSGDSSLKAR